VREARGKPLAWKGKTVFDTRFSTRVGLGPVLQMGGPMRKNVMLRRPILCILGFAAALVIGTAFAEPPDAKSPSTATRELWVKGAEQVLAGNFSAAATTLEKFRQLEPDDSNAAMAAGWMKEAQALARNREQLRQRCYDHYVAEAQKAAREAKEGKILTTAKSDDHELPPASEEEADVQDATKLTKEVYKWGRALDFAQRAMSNAADEDVFRAEPWLKEIVENTLVEIAGFRAEDKWRDALALYDILLAVYPKNQEYKDGFDFCRKRAHLDFVYGAKNDWRADLRGVAPDAITEILSKLEDDYVEQVDFKKACTAGLEDLVLLAEAKSLTKTFPTLGDGDLTDSFANRVKALISRKVEPAARFGPKDVSGIVRSVLEANKDSIALPENVLVDTFVNGLLEPLDEFTNVVWPAEMEEFNKHTRGEFVGVGIQITQPEGSHVRVESPLEDSPAYYAGIKPGDLITEIDGKNTLDMTITQAVREITGEQQGSQVTLTIRDPLSGETRKVTLTRTKIKIRTVSGYHRDDAKPTGWDYFIDSESKIAYVSVSGFMDKTVDDLEQALKQLHREGCNGLILDLRFNPGGLLTSAVRMCELFMRENDPIVQTKGRDRSQNAEIRSRFGGEVNSVPIIVLVNEYSASASEIVAGALAGMKEACVVGARTYGKGSVQVLMPIEDNQAYLKLTTAHYYIADEDAADKWYLLHKKPDSKSWGVEPHVVVKVIPQETSKILRLRRERDLLKGKDQAEIPKEILERQPATTQPNPHLQEDDDPDTDPQLVAAVNIMRVKLLSKQPWAFAPRVERVASHDLNSRTRTSATP
jgi:carboxyl-terminal processing protease